jgi:hypothetical protein
LLVLINYGLQFSLQITKVEHFYRSLSKIQKIVILMTKVKQKAFFFLLGKKGLISQNGPLGQKKALGLLL